MSCPICSSPTRVFGPVQNKSAYYIDCYRCGEYQLSETALATIRPEMTLTQIANISGWIRDHQKEMLASNDYKRLLELKSPTVDEKANKLFMYFVSQYPIAGQKIDLDLDNLHDVLIGIINKNEINPIILQKAEATLPLLAISWAQDLNEIHYILYDYLEHQKGLITFDGNPRITPNGWAYLEDQKYNQIDSQICFVAMWFDKSMDEFWSVLKSSIKAAGYKPIRVDKYQHVNRIDDEIVSLIRQSKFIVADYTGQRAGVYFESGFALGLGLKVFWLCEEIDSEHLHFDTNHYNFIFWDKDKFERLENNLTTRIISIEGKGDYSAE